MVRSRSRKIKKRREIKQPVSFELKPKTVGKQRWIVFTLVGIMCLTLLLNCYFNYTSGAGINEEGETLGEKYFLLGPDPYYHARIVEFIYYNGYVPYWEDGDYDPMLEYPMRHPNPRPPLFDLSLVFGANVLSLFMEDIDALGHSLQIMPAIYGALLVIPVYCIGALLFNRKTAIIGAFFVAIIPLHLGAGHGSAYGLADHDSFLLLLSTIGLFFFLKALINLEEKYEGVKKLFIDNKKAFLYAILTGFIFACIALSWEGYKLYLVLLTVYCIIQLFLNCLLYRKFLPITILGTFTLLSTTIIVLPYYMLKKMAFNDIGIPLSLAIIILCTGISFELLRKKFPYIMTLSIAGTIGVISIYLINTYKVMPMYSFVSMFFKGTVYVGQISLTIAEAGTSDISRSVMGFGPALYWVAWFGAIIFMARTMIHKKKEMVYMSVWFILVLYFTMTAGRFLNDFVPFIAIFAGWTVMFMVEKIDYKKLFKNMNSITGWKKIKEIKPLHYFGIIFLVFIVLLPNVILAFDTAIPWQDKNKYENSGIPMGAYGISFGKEQYWIDAFMWLNDQDLEIENPGDRPAFISWWDYGFYEIFVGKHPTVADNFQDGIEPAANFKTARSEKEAVCVLIARLIHGDHVSRSNKNDMTDDLRELLTNYFDDDIIENLEIRLNDLSLNILKYTVTLIYDEVVCEEYEPEISKGQFKNKFNSYYHYFINITSGFTDDEITEFYKKIQKLTGWEIRYYGTETYDANIFSVFSFLSGKSLMTLGGIEDEFLVGSFVATHKDTGEKTTIYRENITNLTDYDRKFYTFGGPYFDRKPAYYETMFYRTFFGTPVTDGTLPTPTERMPTYGLRHFVPGYISPYVVIAKYYEGCKVNGTVACFGEPIQGISVVVFDEWGIPHDNNFVSDEGRYNIITPAGNLKLGAFLQNNLITTVDISITELEAKRRTENYNKTINIELDPVSLNGTIYDNNTEQPYADIMLVSEITGKIAGYTTDEFGFFEFDYIPPSVYTIHVLDGNNSIHNETIFVVNDMNYDVKV